MKQCKACPWKRSTVPARDIPNGYSRVKHAALSCTVAEPGRFTAGPLRMMACHETPAGQERPCVGWVMNQLGPGNNIGLRMLALDGRFRDHETVGEQCKTLGETLRTRRRAQK